MMKAIFICLFSLLSFASFAQCGLDIETETKDSDRGKNNGKLTVKWQNAVYPVTFKLYDLRSRNYVFQDEKTIKSKSQANNISFEQLKPSEYLIQVITTDCKSTIGGLEGLEVKEIEK